MILTMDRWITAIKADQRHGFDQLSSAVPHELVPARVAGADVAADIIKCRTKPLRQSDYAVGLTPAQLV